MVSKLIIIVAPSGCGKSTLIRRLKEDLPLLKESISTTTRPPRPGEQHGVHYFFVGKEIFTQKMAAGEFVEWAQVHSNYYGTSKEFLQTMLQNGSSVLLDIDTQGADAIKRIFHEQAVAIFIEPPSIEELRNRLEKRQSDRPEVIAERLKNAEKELQRKNDYDHLIMNDDLEIAYNSLKDIVTKHLHL